jgi:hypothetical protein
MILEENDFFVTILEEDDYSPLNSYFSPFPPLDSKEKEEEEDADSNK